MNLLTTANIPVMGLQLLDLEAYVYVPMQPASLKLELLLRFTVDVIMFMATFRHFYSFLIKQLQRIDMITSVS
jgi:hypothetical protein